MKEKLHTGSPLSRNRQAFGAERLMTLLAGNRASRGDSPWDLCRPWQDHALCLRPSTTRSPTPFHSQRAGPSTRGFGAWIR